MADKSENSNLFDWDAYPETRRSFDNIRVAQLNAFDKAVLAISSSALGFSIYLLNLFSNDKVVLGASFLFISWLSFSVAIVLNLGSYLLAAKAAQKDIEELDNAARANSNPEYVRNRFVKLTLLSNLLSLVFFVVGVAALLCFAYLNSQIGVRNG